MRYFIILSVFMVVLAGCDRLRSTDSIATRAAQQFTQGNYRAATADAKYVLLRDPTHYAARLLLAQVAYHQSDLATAQQAIDLLGGAMLQDVTALTLKARVLLAQQHYQEVLAWIKTTKLSEAMQLYFQAEAQAGLGEATKAAQSYTQALALEPHNTELRIAQARVLASQGDIEAALKVTDDIVQHTPQAAAWFLRGHLLLMQGDYKAAKAGFETAAEYAKQQFTFNQQAQLYAALSEVSLNMADVEQTTHWIKNLESRAAQTVMTHYLKARLALLKNNSADAVAELQRAVQLGEYLPARLLLNYVLVTQGAYEQAEADLDRLHAQYPENKETRQLLAQLYLLNNRIAEAQAILPVPNTTDGSDPQTDWLRGQSLLLGGAQQAGINLLERAVAANPHDVTKALMLARAYIVLGQGAPAIKLLNTLPSAAGGTQRQRLLLLANVLGKSSEQAQQAVDKVLADYPEDATVQATAGAFYAQQDQLNRARALLTKAIELDADHIDAHMTLAALDAKEKQFAAARQRLQTLITVHPEYIPARMAVAAVARAQGDDPAAITALEAAISSDPKAVDPRLALATVEFSQQHTARAMELLTQAAEVEKRSAAVLNTIANVLYQAKQYEAALVKYDEAATAGLSVARLRAAEVALNLGKVETARQRLEWATKDTALRFEASAALAKLDAHEDHVDAALVRIATLRSLKLPSEKITELEGDVYALAKRYPQADASYARVLQQAANQRVVLKAYQTRMVGKLTAPAEPLLIWLHKVPTDVQVRRVLAMYYQSHNEAVKAIAEWQQILALNAKDPLAANNLAWLYYQRGDARAEQLAKVAYDAVPNAPAIIDTYGWILVERGKLSEGLALLQQAANSKHPDVEIQYHLAVAEARAGHVAASKNVLRTLLASQESFPLRAQAEQLLQSLN